MISAKPGMECGFPSDHDRQGPERASARLLPVETDPTPIADAYSRRCARSSFSAEMRGAMGSIVGLPSL
jgi:hypothetical protein